MAQEQSRDAMDAEEILLDGPDDVSTTRPCPLPGGMRGEAEEPTERQLVLHLTTLNAECVGSITVSNFDTVGVLQDGLQQLDGTPPELSVLLWGTERMRRGLPIFAYGIPSGDTVNVVRLRIPERYDVLGICDSCDERRYCYYGYARGGSGDWEPVTATCEQCGGRMHDPWGSSDDEGGSESDL